MSSTQDFLSQILPIKGHKFLAVAKSKGYAHRCYTDITKMASDAIKISDAGHTVYFACSGFSEPRVWNPTKERWQYRTHDNAAYARALWIDLDCGEGKDYESARDALLDVVRLSKEFCTPSLIVSSGAGLHCYWTFTADITKSQWQKLSAMFKAVLDHYGVRHDTSRTCDISSVLRPIGTINKKYGTTVRLLKQRGPYAAKDIAGRILRIVKDNFLEVQKSQKPSPAPSLNSDLAVKVEYEPSTAIKIADKCGQIAAVRDSGGDLPEPIWYAALGLLKYTVEGDDVCHQWSQGSMDYDERSCQDKIDQWEFGPTTCAKFEAISPEACADCAHKGKVTSPISLGRIDPEQVNETIEVEVEHTQEVRQVEITIPDSMINKFRWTGSVLKAKQFDKEAKEFIWETFCESFIRPLGFYNDIEKGYCLLMEQYSKERGRSEFGLKGSEILAGGRGLFETLGAAHVPLKYGTKRMMEAYLSSWFNEIKKQADETEIATQYGWQQSGGFLIGNRLYGEDGSVGECLVTGDAAVLAPAMMPTGDLEVWKRMVNTAYGPAGQEQYQFIFGVGYGAPLMPLLGAVPGLVISGVSYETGRGKTTAQRLAMGIYGKPVALEMTAKQTTINAMYIRLGVLNNLPFMLDEVTNVDGMQISNFAYTVSQGQSKLRARGDGTLVNNGRNWCTLVSTSGNRSLVNSVASSKAAAEAEIARILEYRFGDVSTLSKSEADELFSHTNECYGLAGDIYIRYVATHKQEIKALLQSLQRKLDTAFDMGREDRFWSAGITCVLAGIIIANKLGLHDFNIKHLTKWVKHNILHHMERAVSDNVMGPEEAFGTMMAEIANRMIVTDSEGDIRKKRPALILSKPGSGSIDGRVVIDKQLCYLRVNAMRVWCNDNQIDYKQLLQMAETNGWIAGGKKMYALTKGTEMATASCYCIPLRLDRMAQDGDVTGGNLISLQTPAMAEVQNG